jgi:hypothetical protein
MRTIFYEVAELNKPSAEPFLVMRVDVTRRKGDGVEGTVQSLHWTRDAADARAKELTEEGQPCQTCGGSGFGGRGSGYGDVCGEFSGLRYFP